MKQTQIVLIAAVIVVLLVGAYLITRPGIGSPQQYTVSSLPTTVQTTASTSTATEPTTLSTTTIAASNQSYTIKLANNARVGRQLVNGSGISLYLNSQDTPNAGTSVCYDQCEVYWKPFYTANITIPSNLTVSKFGVIIRTGGAKQLTYYGYPLYTYTSDNASGQIKGNGVAGIWFAVTYPNLTT